jgi:hypothetical protein
MTFLAAVSLVLALTPAAATDPGGTFIDDDGHVLEGGIEAIAEQGITTGCNPPFNDRFCPDRVMTRAQMAAMLARALNLPATATDFFIDDEGHVLEGAINRLAAAGITFGCNPPADDRFCPNDPLTRAQAAASWHGLRTSPTRTPTTSATTTGTSSKAPSTGLPIGA